MLLTELSRPVLENLDLGRVYFYLFNIIYLPYLDWSPTTTAGAENAI